ncbi:MAG: response regulator transcription factor [Chloroflexi bacterium]|nr:response regulator transcription factor [Chloroflexota bacterium]
MSPKILVVDDEPPIIEMLSYNLRRASYTVIAAYDGEQAVNLARSEQPDLIILDLMLPKLDGIEVFRQVRRESEVPVIMLTARDAEIDRVVGLELGADDYVVKPFSVRELLARVRNVLRRASAPDGDTPVSVLTLGPLRIDPARREVNLGETEVDLTALEFDVLHSLAAHVEQVLTRDQLLERVWGYDFPGDTRAVDAVIKRLRNKLRESAPELDLIVTVRGVGYKLRVD